MLCSCTWLLHVTHHTELNVTNSSTPLHALTIITINSIWPTSYMYTYTQLYRHACALPHMFKRSFNLNFSYPLFISSEIFLLMPLVKCPLELASPRTSCNDVQSGFLSLIACSHGQHSCENLQRLFHGDITAYIPLSVDLQWCHATHCGRWMGILRWGRTVHGQQWMLVHKHSVRLAVVAANHSTCS